MSNNINYIIKYQKDNTVQINVRLSKKYDADILAHLNSLDNKGKSTYIKELVRKDMALKCDETNEIVDSGENRVIRIEEMAMLIGSSVPTISSWYRWKNQNPEHEAAKRLPDFFRVGPHGARCWHESDVQALKGFKASIKQGRDGLMGSVTQKYVKNSKWSKDYIEPPKTEEQKIKEMLWSIGAERAESANEGGI